jgi:hypothetical protein
LSAAEDELAPLEPDGVCEPAGFCADVAAWPWKALAATTASAPESAAAAATIPRVIAEIRRRPASRARTARRLACSGPPLVSARRALISRFRGSLSRVDR